MSTKHALTLKSTKGNLEILLHMGLDTVELKGRPFDIKVKENDIVTIRGKGRFVIKSIVGNSRKGRLFIEVEKFI